MGVLAVAAGAAIAMPVIAFAVFIATRGNR